jgi:hypothetical protein
VVMSGLHIESSTTLAQHDHSIESAHTDARMITEFKVIAGIDLIWNGALSMLCTVGSFSEILITTFV